MKLIDVIKSRNGLAFLGKNTDLIPSYPHRLLYDISSYDETKNYGNSTFSYKEFVRQFPKEVTHTFIEVVQNVSNQFIKHVLLNKLYEFDGDFIDFENEEITYMPYNKVQMLIGNAYIKTGRQSLSAHKFLTKIFKNNSSVSENQIKLAGDEIVAGVQKYKIEFVEGDEIADYYSSIDCNYWSTSSCMSGRAKSFFKIYSDNPEVCKLGIVKDINGEIVGRFLHWKVTDGYWINDRFYYKEPVVEEWFKKHCEKNNLYFRLDMDEFMHGEDKVVLCLEVELKYSVSDYDEVPYLDTFRYTDGNNEISNTGGRYSLDETDGSNSTVEDRTWDEIAEEYIDNDDAVYVEYGSFEGYTHGDRCVYIDFGIGSGNYALEEDCMYSNANEGWCLV